MASFHILVLVVAMVTLMIPTNANLSPHFYDKVCPQALPVIKSVVQRAIIRERRIGASLLRLHFHDCFVNGCDGSILLDDTRNFTGEKTALPNLNSVRGFSVVDEIKEAVDKACKRPVVSCADILAIAARDSVAIYGGPHYWYQVLLGRRDARTASKAAANSNLPPPSFSFSQLVSNFKSHGLNVRDLVALSGGHTLGFARCSTFRNRIYNASNNNIIDPKFAASSRKTCPRSGGDNNLHPFDATPARVDTAYYTNLLHKKGLLHSDQELFKGKGTESDKLVQLYSRSPLVFATDFKASMIKMGNMKPLTGKKGEIRCNCRRGCDGSVLLDDTPSFLGEKTALPNLNSIRGFEVVDEIKVAVDKACNRPVVSCADILAVAARDSVAILGGAQYWYQVLLGRRDAIYASKDAANANLPPPFFNFPQLLASFQSHGLDLKDLVVLSGGHTIGLAKCITFRDRIFNETHIDPNFAATLRDSCPRRSGDGDTNLTPLDASSPSQFDNTYYKALLHKKGLLHSDQELFKGGDDGGESDRLVQLYSYDPYAFARDFGVSMIKMGNLKPLTGYEGEIRYNCRKVNY
ncbi:Peroxidase 4 [Glycine soja]